jgi:hypothetical protein
MAEVGDGFVARAGRAESFARHRHGAYAAWHGANRAGEPFGVGEIPFGLGPPGRRSRTTAHCRPESPSPRRLRKLQLRPSSASSSNGANAAPAAGGTPSTMSIAPTGALATPTRAAPTSAPAATTPTGARPPADSQRSRIGGNGPLVQKPPCVTGKHEQQSRSRDVVCGA